VGDARGANLGPVKALLFERREARYAAARIASSLRPGSGARVGPLSVREIDPPELPGDDWLRVAPRLSGICGSDLATLSSRTSRYFEPLVSLPFVPGHEIVGALDDGTRVVVDAVLGHAARGEAPPHAGAAPGDGLDYGHLVTGRIEAGIQTGSCHSTGGGWSSELVAHASQLHEVPDDLDDDAAVMVEPTASGIHAALRGDVGPGDTVVVLGAGTIGLCTIAALRSGSQAATIIATAKYPHQRRLAAELGADLVVGPSEIRRAVRRAVGCRMTGEVLSGGADVTIDAVGSAGSFGDAVAVTRPRGRVVLCGMPGKIGVDLAPVWHRETEVVGAYTYGTERLPDGTAVHTFDLATELVRRAGLGRLVSAHYRLDDYVEAVAHAAEAGSRGAVKVVFDLRDAESD
jgi:threonine dehydrogenase-like Zn-dependent dehydrogenase